MAPSENEFDTPVLGSLQDTVSREGGLWGSLGSSYCVGLGKESASLLYPKPRSNPRKGAHV